MQTVKYSAHSGPGWPGLPGICPQGEFPRETALLFLGVGGEQGRAAHSYSSPAAHEPVQRSRRRAGWAAEGLPRVLAQLPAWGTLLPFAPGLDGWYEGEEGEQRTDKVWVLRTGHLAGRSSQALGRQSVLSYGAGGGTEAQQSKDVRTGEGQSRSPCQQPAPRPSQPRSVHRPQG